MRHPLVILFGLLAAVSAVAGETIRWRVEVVYSPSVVSEPREGESDAHLPVHSFAVIQKEEHAHPAIKRVTVGPFIVQSAESDRRMKKIEQLSSGDRVSITVEASAASFREAEKSITGELFVDSDHIEIETGKESANEAPQGTSGEIPPPASEPGAPRP